MPGETEQENQQNQNLLEAPSITLPKGGGAIKGIAEKFEVNAVNGTASFQVPFPVSPARNGFSPSLSLSYNSGSGNGPFGLGWSLSVPSISRKTDKGLPQYNDVDESDVFLLAGAEDLVPMFRKGTEDVFEETRNEAGIDYQVRRYRPRIEGLFARIEQWRRLSDGDIHWRSITRDNLTTIYGQNENARIADPTEPSYVFQWLIEFTYNDKGSCAAYEYKAENLKGISNQDVWEKNRLGGLAPITNRYLKLIHYGNREAYYYGQDRPAAWHFHLLCDYGEHDVDVPALDEISEWSVRHDPFSQYRSGFEVRTYRRCQRVLMFHEFDELGDSPCLVKSTQLYYSTVPGFSFLSSVDQTGWIRQEDGTYSQKSLPPVSFTYQEHAWNHDVHILDDDALNDMPVGIDGQQYQWTDLYSEGISGILSEQAGGLYYKSNLGNGEFAPTRVVSPKPSFTGMASGALQLHDLESTGEKQLVAWQGQVQGFFPLADNESWQGFTAFKNIPGINYSDSNLKWLDLDGDGKADLLITEDDVFRWYPSEGKKGFSSSKTIRKHANDEEGPTLVFADATQSIFLSSMSGGGLPDIVRIRNGSVVYWPNLGYGHFGAKVSMGNAPHFDHPDLFNPQFLRLGDIDGSGTTDIVYLGKDSYSCWLNDSGNQFSDKPEVITPFPQVDSSSYVALLDLLGTGTSCIVWSSPLPKHQGRQLQYIDLMQGLKPHVLIRYENGMGAETNWYYKSSTHYYLEDKKTDAPWVTKLLFPVQVVSQVEKKDHITGLRFASEYSYHHGYYDHAEREFRGFGRVDQTDAESFEHFVRSDASNIVEEDLHQPPVLTKTWFHTGAYLDRERILSQFAHEYYQNESLEEHQLPEPELPEGLTTAEWREALRAFKGQTLRSETYALDGSDKEEHPYVTSQTTSQIRLVQPKSDNRFASFLVTPSESISYHYERNPADPRISHSLVLETDGLGNPLQSAEVVYPRRVVDASLPVEVQQEQAKQHIVCAEGNYTQDIDETDCYRLRIGYVQRSYELTGTVPDDGQFFTLAELHLANANAAEIPYEAVTNGSLQKRLLKQTQSLLMKDDLTGSLLLAEQGKLGLAYEAYQLAFTPDLVTHIYDDKVDDVMLLEGGYVRLADHDGWWVPSGISIYPANPETHFYIPEGMADPFGNETKVTLDAYDFLSTKVTDAIGNEVKAENDYRTLQPVLMTDANLNRTAVDTDELGLVIKSAVMGKEGAGEGDTLDDPTATMDYDLFNWVNHGKPNYVHSKARETHADPNTDWQQQYEYSDGFGNVVMAKAQAEPGIAKQLDASGQVIEVDTGTELRWIGNGRTVLNNKGNPIKQYEPYFSVNPDYEDSAELVETGMSPILSYDAMGRQIRTDMPNGTFTKVEFDPWQQTSWDVNDTVLESDWYAERGSPDAAGSEPFDPETRAAWLAAKHADTPSVVHTDSLGRNFYAVTDYGNGKATQVYSKSDLAGRYSEIYDQIGRKVSEGYTNLIGAAIYGKSAEKGEQWIFTDVMGRLVKAWDNNVRELRSTFDNLHRPVSTFVNEGGSETLFGHVVYGDMFPDAEAAQRNLKGKAYQIYDQVGTVTLKNVDFKGNVIEVERKLTKEYKQLINWSPLEGLTSIESVEAAAALFLEDEVFSSSSVLDAMSRPMLVTLPDQSVVKPKYNKANSLDSLRVKIRGQGDFVTFLENQDYDAKGQRQSAQYGNGLITNYFYNPKTFQLVNLVTKQVGASDAQGLQNLHYTFDPVGNIVYSKDDAQQTHYFKNAVVRPESFFEYDAAYQLLKATGREHAGLGGNAQRNHSDLPFLTQLPHANDSSAVRKYSEHYHYDDCGNILQFQHKATNANWTRRYRYEYQDDASNNTNRLKSTSLPGDVETEPYSDTYQHDMHGNMTKMPHLSDMTWNFMDQLTKVNLLGGGMAFYIFGLGGVRIRKVIERLGGKRTERIYLGAVEIYREYQGEAKKLERSTLHISDNTGRIAQVDTKIFDEDNTDIANPLNKDLIRYQYTNHLGSATMETDDNGNAISYEEYHPYGTSAYRSSKSGADLSLKRYRFSGKERDDETGLHYFGARFYAAWLGRWTSSDPAGFVSGFNLFRYCSNNPVMKHDPNGMQDEAVFNLPSGAKATPQDIGQSVRDLGYKFSGYGENHNPKLVKGLWDFGDFTQIGAGDPLNILKGKSAPSGITVQGSTPSGAEPAAKPAAASASASSDSSSESAEGTDDIHGNIVSAATTNDSFQRGRYEAENHSVSNAAQDTIKQAKTNGNPAKALDEAREVSSARNARRIATQKTLTPPGEMLSRALEGERSFEHMHGTYSQRLPSVEGRAIAPTDNVFEISRRIAVASGESRPLMKYLGRAGRYAGPVGMAFSGYALVNDLVSEDYSMAAGDALTVIGGGVEVYALTVSSATVFGASAVPVGLAVGGIGLAVTSGISGYRAYQQGDTAGAVAGGVGVAAGLAITFGAVGVIAGIAAAPAMLAIGIVAAIGVGLFHLGRWLL